MNRHKELLRAWDSRSESLEVQQYSPDAREDVASVFLQIAEHHEKQEAEGELEPLMADWPGMLASRAVSDDLSVPAFCAELRRCQISLIELLLNGGSADVSQAVDPEIIVRVMNSVEQLIAAGIEQLNQLRSRADDSTEGEPKVKVKTLQHEIRTPLQGALLTTELMLEDAQQGDAVQPDDIIAVRRSIETAVQVLNDFAEKPA